MRWLEAIISALANFREFIWALIAFKVGKEVKEKEVENAVLKANEVLSKEIEKTLQEGLKKDSEIRDRFQRMRERLRVVQSSSDHKNVNTAAPSSKVPPKR